MVSDREEEMNEQDAEEGERDALNYELEQQRGSGKDRRMRLRIGYRSSPGRAWHR